MKIERRNLRVGLRGDDVKQLHDELTLLDLPIRDDVRQQQVFDDAVTLPAVRAMQERSGLPSTGVVDEATAAAISAEIDARFPRAVDGYVRTAEDTPAPGVLVQAFDQDFRNPVLLGSNRSDSTGYYAIRYSDAQVAEGDAGLTARRRAGSPVAGVLAAVLPRAADDQPLSVTTTADVWVGVPGEGDTFRARSETVYNAGRSERIDLVLPTEADDHSELERLVLLVLPRIGAVPLHELTDEDIAFLAGDTETPRDRVALLVVAARLTQEAKALFTGAQPAPKAVDALLIAFYGLLRRDAPRDLAAVLRLGVPAWREALEAAARDGIIRFTNLPLDEMLATLADIRIQLELAPVQKGGRASLGDVIRSLPGQLQLADEVVAGVLHAVAAEESEPGELPTRLMASGLKRPQVFGVLRAVALNDLTGGHLPLIEALQKSKPSADTAALRDLVAWDRRDWVKQVKTTGVPVSFETSGEQDPADAYAETLLRKIEALQPTEYIAARMRDGRIAVPDAAKEAVQSFVAKNQGFRFGDHGVLSYLADERADLKAVPDEALPALRDALLRVERAAKVSPNLEHAERLLALGFDSAHSITARSQDAFVAEAGGTMPGGAAAALDIYQRAQAATATVAGLMLVHSPRFNTATLPVVPDGQSQAAQSVQAMRPFMALTTRLPASLRALFGSIDFCGCAHCASLYSPAAYFVDLLHALDSGPANAAGKTPLGVLLDRRPDLGEINLTCDNTNVLTPYLDLALDVLESSIAHRGLGIRISRDGQSDTTLDNGSLTAVMREQLRGWGVTVADDAEIVTIGTGPQRRWLVRDDAWRLTLTPVVPGAYRLLIWPQTTASDPSGHQAPSLITAQRYQFLAASRFPWTLPFELQREETNAWLERLEVPRASLMEAFAGAARWQAEAAACERLGISASEKALLTGGALAEQDWGFGQPDDPLNNTWTAADPIAGRTRGPGHWADLLLGSVTAPAIGGISLLRARARLTHRELLNLLDTRFMQSTPGLGGRLTVTGDECDTAEQRIELPGEQASRAGNLTQFRTTQFALLRRLHLLVRLWRRLGWSVSDVDRALASFAAPVAAVGANEAFTPSVLVFLANLARLTRETGLPIELLLTLFRSSLDTTGYWTYTADVPRREPSTFDSIFANPSIARPRNDAFELDAAGQRLQAPVPGATLPRLRISDHQEFICASLSAASADLQALLPESKVTLPASEISAPLDGASVCVDGRPRRTFELLIGAVRGTNNPQFTIQLQHADDGQPFVAVPATELDAAPPAVITAADGSRLLRWNYSGTRRNLRISVTAVQGTTPRLWVAGRVLVTPGLVDDELTLANLTRATRYLILGRAVRMPLAELRSLLECSGIDPFAGPAATLRLIEVVRRLRARGLSVQTVDAVLRHRFASDQERIDGELRAALLLTAIRGGLRAIRTDTTAPADRSSDLARRALGQLGWNTELVDAVLSRSGLASPWSDHVAPLDQLPIAQAPGFTYDAQNKRLIAGGSTRPAAVVAAVTAVQQRTDYLALSATSAARQALDAAMASIVSQSRERQQACDALRLLMRSIELPTHTQTLPGGYQWTATIPPKWSGRFYYDAATRSLRFVGWMTGAERTELLELRPADADYRNAVQALFTTAAGYQEGNPANTLAVEETAAPPTPAPLTTEALLYDRQGLEERSALLVSYLLPVVRRRLSAAFVAEQFANALSISPPTAAQLLASMRQGGQPTFDAVFLVPAFAESDPSVPLTRAGFEPQFAAALRAEKHARLIARLGLGPVEVPWLFGAWTAIDFADLPVLQVEASSPRWNDLLNLLALIDARDRLQTGAAGLETLRSTSAIAQEETRVAVAARVLQLQTEEDSRALLNDSDILLTQAAGFRDAGTVAHLVECVHVTRPLATSAATVIGWKREKPTVQDAQRAKQTARARFGDAGWAEASKPVLDVLRGRRRDALVEYLVHADGVRDAADLFGRYLIDTEMGPCMMTSRIKQAIGSTQLFIQRCLLSLEDDVLPSAINRDRWAWMNSYRVWEANRKVLLYPENWIEPELRDDKSHFYQELEGELLQADITDEKAELAIRAFLDRIGDASRLDVVGLYREMKANRLETLHVFGRTLGEPRQYYYRRFQKLGVPGASGHWTPWERLEVDVEGDHLVPVVWRGRLLLFWPVFSEEATSGAPPTPNTVQEPSKHWGMKLAWSEYRQGRWSSRRVSQRNCLFVRLPVVEWPRSAIYIAASAMPGGVALQIRLSVPPLTLLSPPWDSFDGTRRPLTILCFDGEQVIPLMGLFQYKAGLSQTWQLSYSTFNPAASPIPLPPLDSILPHDNLRLAQAAGAFTLPRSGGSALQVLASVPRAFALSHSPQDAAVEFRAPSGILPWLGGEPLSLVLNDGFRQFFVYPTNVPSSQFYPASGLTMLSDAPRVSIFTFDHPQVPRLRQVLADQGVEGLLKRDTQREPATPLGVKNAFATTYGPNPLVVLQSPDDDIDFSAGGAYSSYNWELFFHLPFAIACLLSRNQRFEEARRWFHVVFDPTDNTALNMLDPTTRTPERFWRFRPFAEVGRGWSIEDLVRKLADPADQSPEKLEFTNQVARWKDLPFRPHVVARMRPRAYMFSVVMKYLDNLIAWGDQLFRRDTLESLNQAVQVYVLAAQMLGRRPEAIPRRTRPAVKAFNDFARSLDELSNALVESENVIPTVGAGGAGGGPLPPTLYFCAPENAKLAGYYDTIEDRLFKVRHCMNLDGITRQLALFEPPIDPALLVRAVAAGVDIATAIAGATSAPIPKYRFAFMIERANELCSEVKSLGAALLAAIEKRDAEQLARLRSGHELQVLEQVRAVKELQIQEAKTNIDALGKSLDAAHARLTHYLTLVSSVESVGIPAGPTVQALAQAAIEEIGKATKFAQSLAVPLDGLAQATAASLNQVLSRATEALSAALPPERTETARVPMNPAEVAHLRELGSARDLQQKAMGAKMVAQILALVPDITLGTSGAAGSPVVTAQIGGSLLSTFANLQASMLDSQAAEHTYRGNLHSILAGYQRRAAEWVHGARLASLDVEMITKQLSAAGLRLAIAAQDLRNHDLQVENARAVDEFMHDKYTNRELYVWMEGQLSGVYFQAYQLAYDVARKAERGFQHELGSSTASFIQFGYWDSMRKGLLSGERLSRDIRRMEVAYQDLHQREYELTKHVSLLQIDPLALLELRATGRCTVSLRESLFDMEAPGHYFRRLKTVAVTIPCVVGPYATVNCTLTLLKSTVRTTPALRGGAYTRSTTADDDRFVDQFASVQSIVTSSAQNDSGLFETNLRDERYLPFEGTGAVSEWQLELPANPAAGDPQQFDYETISDVILHLRYTAREGGGLFRKAALDEVKAAIAQSQAAGSVRLFSVRHEFPTEWAQFQARPAQANTAFELALTLRREHYPFWSDLRRVAGVTVVARSAEATVTLFDQVDTADTNTNSDVLSRDISTRDLLVGHLSNIPLPTQPAGPLRLYLDTKAVTDLWIAVTWSSVAV